MNIHRDPLCGRNFEYYSEDPLVTGQMALAATLGVQSKNVGVTIKHFYANNREASRSTIDTHLSERASREIYLKGFEIVVKGGDPWCLMTSYNLVNSQETAELYDLNMVVLREQWGFKGFIVTDWGNDSAHFKEELAGNDVKMSSGNTANLTAAYEGGVLSRAVLEANVERVLNVIMRTSKFKEVIANPDLLKSAEKPIIHEIGKTAVTDVKAAQFAAVTGAVQTETTSDTYSPGLNVGYMDAGGSITYYLDVAQGGVYSMGFRYAANSSPFGQYTIQAANSLLPNGQPNYRNLFNKPSWANTGGWQNWQNSTYYSMGVLPAGEHYLRINITGGGSNLNVLFFRLDTAYADIRFDRNGATGGSMVSGAVVPGASYTVPACGFEYPSFLFAGFKVIGGALDGTIVQSGDTIAEVTESITLQALWIPPKPVVIDAEAVPYVDGAATFVSGAVDVFISPVADTTYYYKIGESKNWLDVYYKGETNNPSGSYFDGSLINGALVMALGDSLDYVSGTLVTGNKITVPGTPAKAAVLEVIAYKDGKASKIFTHEFRCGEPTGAFFQAVYDSRNYMVSAAQIGYKPTGIMDVDFSAYPLGEYYYKVFSWDENYVPLFEAITFK